MCLCMLVCLLYVPMYACVFVVYICVCVYGVIVTVVAKDWPIHYNKG